MAANDRAWNTGDTTTLLATMTPAGTFSVVPTIGRTAFAGPYAGLELADFASQMHGEAFTVTVTGRLVVVSGKGKWSAAQPVRISFRSTLGGETVKEGWDLFTVVDDRGTKLISQEVWWPSG